MAARLTSGTGAQASQLTSPQKILSIVFTLSGVGILVAPGFKVFPVVEIVAMMGIVSGAWAHFIAFKRASMDSFGQVDRVQVVPGQISNEQATQKRGGGALNSTTVKHVQRAREKLGKNMTSYLVTANIIFVIFVCLSPLWPANDSRECQVRFPFLLDIFHRSVAHIANPFFAHRSERRITVLI